MDCAHAVALLGAPVSMRVVGRFVHRQQKVAVRRERGLELIPLLGANRPRCEPVHARKIGILHHDGRRLHGRVDEEGGSLHLRIPRPVVFRVGARVEGNEALARLDESLDGRLLFVVEDVARRQRKDDDLVVGEPLVGQDRAQHVRPDEIEVVELGEPLQSGNGGLDRVVVPAGGIGDEQRLELGGESAGRRYSEQKSEGKQCTGFHRPAIPTNPRAENESIFQAASRALEPLPIRTPPS